MTGPAERARLAELARAATPGPWVHGNPHNFGDTFSDKVRTSDGLLVAKTWAERVDAAYIAAANPTVILALLADIAALEAVASAARGYLPVDALSTVLYRVDRWEELAVALRALDEGSG